MHKAIRTAMVAAAAAMSAVLLMPTAAHAVNDSFWVYTSDGCGALEFVDNGTYSDGSTNDDFFKVHDYCTDGHGVLGIVVLNDESRATKYNGLGYAGPPVYWDPFGNILTNERVYMEVCLVDGGSDQTGDKCRWNEHIMVDG
jgi:hypothetical protein